MSTAQARHVLDWSMGQGDEVVVRAQASGAGSEAQVEAKEAVKDGRGGDSCGVVSFVVADEQGDRVSRGAEAQVAAQGVEEEKDKRCAYCGGERYHAPGTPRPENYCRCRYRTGRMGEFPMESETTARHNTLADFHRFAADFMSASSQDTPCIFKISVTTLDLKKIAKADAMRENGDTK